MQVKPSKEEFSKLAKQGNIVAVAAEVSTDLDTPVSIYYKLVGEEKGFMLESATINQQFGRFSFIGTEPLAEIDVFKGRIIIKGKGGNTVISGSPVDALKVYLAGFDTAAQEAVLPLMNGGAVGYFNYEVVSTFDRIRGLDVADDQILGQFMICRIMIVVDHFKNTSQIVCLAEVGADSSAGEVYEAARQKIMAVKARLQQTVQPAPVVPKRGEKLDFQKKYGQVTPEFLEMIRRGKAYITAGDAFQIVLSEQFRCQVTQPAFNFYRRLRQVNPSAYMFYLNFGSKKLIGASPEMLVKISGDMVYTYPIAGSRRRGATAAEDEVLAAELCADTKECAEHAMLVDLSRNDVGRISYPGTVKVQKMMQVEKFSHIMHLVSEVCGQVRKEYTALDVLRACFPAGTLSGAPKLRAMEIIQELEGKERNAYAGTVGYLDFSGNMDMCITIRTMRLEGKEAFVQAGAGIVADSVAESEYKEALQKAGALFQVIEEVENHDLAD